MAFESIAAYLDKIEEGFGKKQSPATIAKNLGIPKQAKTIRRYKAAVWDLKDLVDDAREIRAAKHDAKRNGVVEEIVNTLEVINLGKLRAKQLLSVSLGDEFEVSDGTKHRLTLGSASIYWPIGTQMLKDMAKIEMELSGDDPESRKASALESLSEDELDARLQELLAIINEAEGHQNR
jgi:hypothetical protein